MPIVWRDAMSVEDERIDSDHKKLIEIINDFEAAVHAGAAEADLKRVFQQLMGYAAEHFAREEKLQKLIQYPYANAHHHEHANLVRQVKELFQRYVSEKDAKKKNDILSDIAGFLKSWLVDHIIESDLRMKPYIRALAKTGVPRPRGGF